MKVTLTIGQLRRLVLEAAFKNAPELPLELAVTDVAHQMLSKGKDYFFPVTVRRGRKFRGNGYIVSSERVSNGGFAGNGARPLAYYTTNKVWDPNLKCLGSFNGNIGDPGVEEWKVSDDEMFEDLTDYVKSLVNQCVKKCGSDYRHRMFWLRKVLGISTDLAEELANATKELDGPEELEVSDEDPGNQAEPEFGKDPTADAMAWKDLQNDPKWSEEVRAKYPTYWKDLMDHYGAGVDEAIDWISSNRRDDGRHEFIVTFNNTRRDPMDVMYRDSTRMWARDEREVERNLRNWHPEYEITKVVKVREDAGSLK